MDNYRVKAGLKYVIMESGGPSAMISGMTMMLQLYVLSSATQLMVRNDMYVHAVLALCQVSLLHYHHH